MSENKKTLIILPTYNEQENLEKAIAAIFVVVPGANILVVDDNSPDGTGAIADRVAAEDQRVFALHRAGKSGLGKAYLDGFRYALEKGYDYIFEMDADLSHDPRYLPDFFSAVETSDLVIGSRYIKGVNVINWPMARLLLSFAGNMYARFVTGMNVTDLTGGFKCFRREALAALDFSKISSSGYSFQIEVSYILWKKGFRIREIPIIFVDRQFGETKMSTGIIREALFLIWKLRFRNIHR
ncbi:MAG: dolichyl-phosphate beta-D-mannosyltransferase [Candidatus Raymondbacteria bacterium RifOxyC12_full_50_8]|uniref:Dolichyl-phosphate beta-D-mannosyltransferase n=1 Tax=Candidatus Raymondbacteria bacterium RIFOXYD12_FULL_49_13 TaxID=1817890 RepID=A0A1F7F6M4_UNCRA|nr:MAG: dolichyl-phosphate beta-D-mannosyltransferase [Candidatus Raymondbacteria bacterium RifOxyB12_full_50_8]OGJ93184.1 MAG: dolichyl-phosphate beta-D-mannosyltransferase [Candidatus Raymondbacteria bacterium RIFOXYA2_FULL_49_16]OGJ93367.1 MAG: dolichyl-phosphate beta-D-mannosyltransferase [Candidatus Raymondbacteria bacterium RifOxyC12_full_50_8]OGK02291.1 MAG: dolichyl-phosphate beta-D-mannosyltransferase [Candidatus Raymondbacteria bacterium RIFOXYD12_FULL_49_13]OGP44906.1 MAG: dolichyl-p